jgi:hypothetical protein
MGGAGQASSTDVSAFYDEFVDRQTRVGVNRRHRAIVDWLLRFGMKPDDSVLELGCGVGTVTELVSKELGGGRAASRPRSSGSPRTRTSACSPPTWSRSTSTGNTTSSSSPT